MDMTEPQAALWGGSLWDGSLACLFAALDEACRQGFLPRRRDRAGPPERAVSFAGAGEGGKGPPQMELFADPEVPAAGNREEGCGGPGKPAPSQKVFPALRDSGSPSGSFSAALLYGLSVNAFDALVHAWMSELPIEAELLRFAWKVIRAAREEARRKGPPDPPPRPALPVEPAGTPGPAGTGTPAGTAAIYGHAWAALPEARLGAEKAASNRGDPDVRVVLEAAYKVRRETDRLMGLLRFSPCPRGGIPGAAVPSGGADVPAGTAAIHGHAGGSGAPVYIARCSPDHHILPALAEHFTQRFGECPWAIIDEKRNLVLAREPGEEARLFPLHTGHPESSGIFPPGGSPGPGKSPAAGKSAPPDTPAGSGNPEDCGNYFDCFEALWRNYHRSINNPDRNNPALQRQFMPRRYWKYLPELR